MEFNIVLILLTFCLESSAVTFSRSYDSNREARLKMSKRAGKNGDVFENLLQVYDPSFLAMLWPKISNGVHLSIDPLCWDDMGELFKDLSDGRLWAFKAVDSSGRYQSGLADGNRFWLGSKPQCLGLENEYKSCTNNGSRAFHDVDYATAQRLRARYFDEDSYQWTVSPDQIHTSDDDKRAPIKLAYSTLNVDLNITRYHNSFQIILGVCLPKSCRSHDVETIINFSITITNNLKTSKMLSRNVKIRSSRQIQSYYDTKTDSGYILLAVITVILIAICVTATIVELDCLKLIHYRKKSMSFDVEKANNTDKDRKIDDKTDDDVSMYDDTISRKHKVEPIFTMELGVDRTINSCNRCGKYKKQCNSLNSLPACWRANPPIDKKRSFICQLLLCFSLIHSWKRIFNKNTANKDLSLIHGLKIVATFWVIYVHLIITMDQISGNLSNTNEYNNVYYILATGTIAYDTLFFISGLFSSHHFFYLKSRYSVEELVNFGGACGQALQFVCFVFNRVIRLLPSYAYIILLSAVVARVYNSTSVLTLSDNDHVNCDYYWWRNILYISNMFNEDQQCLQISWFLSTETQLHAVGALACAASVSATVSNSRAKIVAAFVFLTMMAASVVDFTAAYYDNGLLSSSSPYSAIIDRPWARVAPYFSGVLAGWLTHVMSGRLKVSTITSSLLWVMTSSLLVTSSALPWLTEWWAGAAVHVAWPLALMWPALVCATKHAALFRRLLSNSYTAALSRLCYGMLLVHSVTTRVVLLGTDTNVCSNINCVWIYFSAVSVLTVWLSLLLSLLVEIPCCSLLRRLSDCANN